MPALTVLCLPDSEVRESQGGSSLGPRQQTGPTRSSEPRGALPETSFEKSVRRQGLVHPAVLGHNWDGTRGRFQEDSVSHEDPIETDSRGH